MGMGRHLLRRKALAGCIFLVAGMLYAHPVPVRSFFLDQQKSSPPRTEAEPRRSITPVQGHAGIMAHSFPGQSDPLLLRYLREYGTAEGLAWIQRALDRARPYRDFIARAVYEAGLPPELEFLPVVESEYRVGAVSKSGAVGLWQFMLNSIGPHGLVVDEWEDQRRDFWASTEASLAKLRGNYEYLGDWLLALAAYNCGLGCTARAVRAAGTADYWELCKLGYLPPETVHYVPKFLAVAYYASFAGRHGLSADWEPPASWERVPLDTPVDMEILARAAGVPLEPLRQGNAELRYSVTPPRNAPHLLKIPADYAERVRAVLEQPDTRLVDVALHTVASGDTLYDLSRHYRIPVSMIQRYNPRTNPRTLRIGTRLVIPLVQQVGPYRRPTGTTVPFSGSYTVRSGDTLWAIARRYGVRVEDLAATNGLGVQSVLRIGTELKVPSAPAEEPDMRAYAR